MATTDETISTGPKVPLDDVTVQNAARTIQRAYRGYRTRSELRGLGLDASTRWAETPNGICSIVPPPHPPLKLTTPPKAKPD
ncbi:hypothetical protein P170DRAFT_9102 [Aspergillus steynii IBT 23096]|uniref:Uncharacterized protein n=1 Tax=Aspergillus steynii IBT 23096 TaxID=1392250 RepID=A0A2I2GMQ4_9EURO|nr:uncharacterized protein P170DRAFT_9102 [Aspergillus steynii IBT 23096]PLB54157.1 hypothetical protein P170DRAFT_9102 [Aspergillus steynii IBT 23096]